MEGTDTSACSHDDGAYFPVHINSAGADVGPVDLYIRYGIGEQALYCARGAELTPDERQRLIEQGIEFLYVPATQHDDYCEMLRTRLSRLFRMPEISKEERGRVLRDAAVRLIDNVLLFPHNPESVRSVEQIARLYAQFAGEDEDAFSFILNLSDREYDLAGHMLNVGVGCGLLVKELRPDDEELAAMAIQGGFLHDIGKRNVPPEALRKEGKLSALDWERIRAHPSLGYEELLQQDVSPVVLQMMRDHHEQLDGRGFPAGIDDEQIGFAARVCAVVDVFDRIAAAQVNRRAVPPGEALRIMSEGVGTHFDAWIFSAWRNIIKRLLQKNPERALPERAPGPRRSLHSFLQAAVPCIRQSAAGESVLAVSPAELPDRLETTSGGERRLYLRRACSMQVSVVFERQMKECAVRPGEPFEALVRDLSRSGLQLQTPWPLTQNDLLTISFRSPDGIIRRRARVVRVRRNGRGAWIAGACFVAEELRKSA